VSGAPGRAIAVAVVVENGTVLVGTRASDAVDAPGLHEFPGGLVEPGESPAEAAARECLEETGVAIAVGDLLATTTAPSSRGEVAILFFGCRPVDGAAARPPFRWIPLRALASCDFPAANRPVVARLLGNAP